MFVSSVPEMDIAFSIGDFVSRIKVIWKYENVLLQQQSENIPCFEIIIVFNKRNAGM